MNLRMNRRKILETSFGAALLGLLTPAMRSALAQSAAAAPVAKVLSDSDGAQSRRVDGLNLVRYIEIFLATNDPKTGKVVAPCYNSTFSAAGIPPSKDTAPQALVEGLDFDRIKADFGVLGASLNGPKLWMPDWVEVQVGVNREFNGINTAWVAELHMGNPQAVSQVPPYKPVTIARKSGVGWTKGTTALLLDDADGNTWVMKGFQLGLQPQITYEQFVAAGAGNFKKLPPGWKFRLKTLDQDLVERPADGLATIMADEHFNVYDKTGPGMTNYKP